MKKLMIIGLFTHGLIVNAQFIISDSKDRSSILNQPTSVGLDVTDEKVKFEFNNIHGQAARENKFLTGLKYTGGNSQGIGQLFKGGDFVYGSEMVGFVGFSALLKDSVIFAYDSLIEKFEKDQTSIRTGLISKLNKAFQDLLAKVNPSTNYDGEYKKMMLRALILSSSNKMAFEDLKPFQNKFLNPKKTNLADSSYMKFLETYEFSKAEIDLVKDFYLTSLDEIEKTLGKGAYHRYQRTIEELIRQKNEYEQNRGAKRFTSFLRGGINGKKFNTLDTLGTSEIQFQEIKFRGGFIELGFNLFMNGRVYIGLSFVHEWTDNLADLTETEFATAVQDTISDKVYQFKETKKAFINGEYQKFEKDIVFIDVGIRFPFKDQSTLIAGPYFRQNYVVGYDKLKNTQDLGLGVNWHKNSGKFLFGVYLEAPDVRNNNDKDGNISDRLSFGFRTNYSFNTLLGIK